MSRSAHGRVEGSRELDGSFRPSANVAWRDDEDLDGAEAKVGGRSASG